MDEDEMNKLDEDEVEELHDFTNYSMQIVVVKLST